MATHGKGANSKEFTVCVPPDLGRAVEAAAQKEKFQSNAAIFRKAVVEYLERRGLPTSIPEAPSESAPREPASLEAAVRAEDEKDEQKARAAWVRAYIKKQKAGEK